VQFDDLQFLEIRREVREPKTKAGFPSIQTPGFNTLEYSSPSPEEDTTRTCNLGFDKVTIEVLDEEGPGEHAQDEVLVDP
jgi:hypothetical protein